MAYPAASDFVSGATWAAWWTRPVNGVPFVCSTQGRTFVRALQRKISTTVRARFDVNGTSRSPTEVGADGILGPITYYGAIALADALGAPARVMTALVGAAPPATQPLGTPIALDAQKALIWLFVGDGGLTWDALSLPATTRTLQWRKSSGDDSQNALQLKCVPADQAAQSAPQGGAIVQVLADVPITVPNRDQQAAALLPFGAAPVVPSADSSSLSTGEKVALAALLLAAAGGAAAAIVHESKTPTRS
jgi:hypothetical protein